MHCQRQQKLIAQVIALHELTNKAFTQNTKQLDLKAHELNQIIDAIIILRKYLMSTEDDTDQAVDEDNMDMVAENNQMENPDAK